MQTLVEMWSFPFMRNALIAGVMLGLLCSYYGVFIVQRGMAFLGEGLAHAAFGGVALALLLGWTPLWVAFPFTLAVSLGIVYLKDKTDLAGDTTIGIFFALSVALGVLFLGIKKTYTVDAFSYLFGSILSVGVSDLWVVGILLIVSVVLIPLTWSRLAYITFDAELARSDGVSVRFLDYFLATMVALVVVAAAKVVGTVLVASLLVIPAATARMWSSTLYRMTWFSCLVGVVSTSIGLGVSYILDVPSGSTVILSQGFCFMVAVLSRRLFRKG